MSKLTIAFIPGTRYQFRPKRGTPNSADYHTRVLTFIRDELGDRQILSRVIHHIFQLTGGALECFTDVQAGDFVITKI